MACFSVCGACADACLALLLHAAGLLQGTAGLPVGWPLPVGWNLLLNRSFYSGPGLALMLAGLVGWPLPGGWNLLLNRLFYMFWGLR